MSGHGERGGGRMLGDILRDLLAARGVDLDTVDTRPRCVTGCRELVERDGGWCHKCAAGEDARVRRERVASAEASLPDWPWCRAGSENFEGLKSAAPEIFETMNSWRLGSGSLLLLGSTGIGKTAAVVAKAHAILSAAVAGKLPPDKMAIAAGMRFVHVADMAHARRNHPLGDGDPPILRMAQAAPLLLLDELGREPVVDTSVFELLDQRYRAALPTIVTSNLLRSEIRERYGTAGERRILGLGRVVEVRKEAA